MLELFDDVNWQEYSRLLFDGSPSMFTQLLVFNGLVLAVWAYRKWRKYHRLPSASRKAYKGLFVIFNALILFQDMLNLRGTVDLIMS